MGLPPGYRLDHGTRRDRVRLLGNGVCPPVMEAVVRTLIGPATSEAHDPGSADIGAGVGDQLHEQLFA